LDWQGLHSSIASGKLNSFFSENACISWGGSDGSVDFHAANGVMDIARRPFHLRNRERCQEEDTLIRLGSPLVPLATSREPPSVIFPKDNPRIWEIYHGRQGNRGEGKRKKSD
jgi:hypothetical protein